MRKTKLLVSILSLVLILSIFAGCQYSGMDATQATEPSSEATEPSSEATEPSEPIDPNVLFTEVPTQGNLKALYDKLVNYAISDRYPLSTWYYGAINDCIVVFMEGNTFWTRTIVVADCEFYHTQGFYIFVYKGGERCKLEEAYEKGWLTKDHIKQLETRHLEVMAALDEWRQSKNESQGS